MAADSLSSTYHGYIGSTHDALLVIEASLQGSLKPVLRRPNQNERERLITSGCVLVYNNRSSGITRWTDGKLWSSSRVRGDFILYHEAEGDCRPRQRRTGKPTKMSATKKTKQKNLLSNVERDLAGPLIGPSVLIKKTMSVKVESISYTLISYYTPGDISNLTTPSKDPRFQNIHPRADLTSKQGFRKPGDEVGVSGSKVYDTCLPYRNQNVAVPGSTHSQFPTPYTSPPYYPGIRGATPRPHTPRPAPLATSFPWIPNSSRDGYGPYSNNYPYSSPATHGIMGGYLSYQPHVINGILPGTNQIGQRVGQHGPWITERKPM
jgi:hypothetical protein